MGWTQVLLFRARERLCAIPVECAVETMRPLAVEPFPNMPPFVLGVSMVRGVTVPVVDAGALLHGAGAAAPTRFVLLRVGSRRVALAVEGVIDVRAIDRATLNDLPPLLGSGRGNVVDAIGTLDRELFVMLQSGRLVPDTLWRALDAVGAPA